MVGSVCILLFCLTWVLVDCCVVFVVFCGVNHVRHQDEDGIKFWCHAASGMFFMVRAKFFSPMALPCLGEKIQSIFFEKLSFSYNIGEKNSGVSSPASGCVSCLASRTDEQTLKGYTGGQQPDVAFIPRST